MSQLIVKEIGKHYKKRWVVKNVSINVSDGEIVGLLGPNGAGKTTSFYMIVGLVHPDHGTILLDGDDITKTAMYKRARCGVAYLPQEPSIFRKLTVEENLLAILELRKDLSVEQKQEHLEHLLNEFHITHIRDSVGISLSGGERRRVEIARALVQDPKFILLDEPFAGVDPISMIDIKKIINQLKNRGIGVLITDHNVRETLDICTRAYIVSDGQIICEGGKKDILENHKVREVYLGHEFDIY